MVITVTTLFLGKCIFRKLKFCHLALGKSNEALQFFEKSLVENSQRCLDDKLVKEATKGLQKAKLRNYEEMFQLCDQSLDAADNNYYSASVNSETRMNYPARVWRSGLRAKAFFYLGRLEETLASFEMVEAKSSMQKFRSKSPEAAGTLAVTVRELLGHKGAGDEALRLGRHLEAFEHYTSALSCSLESRPFSAICLFKRAAANEALGPITNAIADCSLAIALAGNYPKALFKRATLHEMIRDYRSATTDLQRLISEQKGNQSGEFTRLTDDVIDLGEAQSRLTMVKEMAKKRGIKLDMYLILGLEPSCVASDITAAYRKAALRHHPDKAPLSLSRNGNGDNAVWKEIAPVVNKDAELLFKTIGEAYTELSNSDTSSFILLVASPICLEVPVMKAPKSARNNTPISAFSSLFEKSERKT
ncbi:hypothetical protein ACHQM5_012591 [Ranunculus cassubicifolius]